MVSRRCSPKNPTKSGHLEAAQNRLAFVETEYRIASELFSLGDPREAWKHLLLAYESVAKADAHLEGLAHPRAQPYVLALYEEVKRIEHLLESDLLAGLDVESLRSVGGGAPAPVPRGSRSHLTLLPGGRSGNPHEMRSTGILRAVVDEAIRTGWRAPRQGGLADGRRASEFPREALIEGAGVELEHTDDPWVALRIAMDHLVELPDYYERLRAVEANPDFVKAELLRF